MRYLSGIFSAALLLGGSVAGQEDAFFGEDVGPELCKHLRRNAQKESLMLLVKDHMQPYLVYWGPELGSSIGVYFGESADELRNKAKYGHYPYFAPHQYIMLDKDGVKGITPLAYDINGDGSIDLVVEFVAEDRKCYREFFVNDPFSRKLIKQEKA